MQECFSANLLVFPATLLASAVVEQPLLAYPVHQENFTMELQTSVNFVQETV